ncbi:AN1-type zinc finger domain-containing protein [Halorubrum trapanicum]|uniref:AN1-type zinc finger domain-containing protein n=1 Tax=Halorubrum trapanicum TaxID=29284 RepID=UPI000BBB5B12|nr:AN1-type zinc finger protein [Halorubrum trapanicum]
MTDGQCIVCGSSANTDGMPYRCAYCGDPVCSDHRLPENHGCSGERLAADEDPEDRGPQPMDSEDVTTMGTTPTETGQSSPDVALDGSIARDDPAEQDDEESESWWRRLLPW